MKHQVSHRKIGLVIPLLISALLAIVIGKLVAGDKTYDPILYIYGIAVTAAIVLLISVRYLKYVDPYLIAQSLLESNPSLQQKSPFVTIMVAAFNEEDFIDDCLSSLRNQSYPNFEVIVVNDASTDATKNILANYATDDRFKIINLETNVGKKKALGAAILEARGTVFVFTDSDSVIESRAVERVVDIFKTQPNIGAISGHTRAYNADTNLLTRIQDTWYEGQFSIRKAYESSFGAVSCVSGPLAAFRRAAVFNLIPLWINDTFLGSEFKFATDRGKTALVLGSKRFHPLVRRLYPDSPFLASETYLPHDWQVVYSQSARALTNVPDSFGSFLKQQIRWKKSFVRNIWLTGAFYWQKPLPAAFMYYLRAVFVFVGPFIVFRNLVWLPLNGDWYSATLYVSGILFVGFTFATLHKIERPNEDGWVYRPLMNFISTFVLSWLIFYSVVTIKKMVWQRS